MYAGKRYSCGCLPRGSRVPDNAGGVCAAFCSGLLALPRQWAANSAAARARSICYSFWYTSFAKDTVLLLSKSPNCSQSAAATSNCPVMAVQPDALSSEAYNITCNTLIRLLQTLRFLFLLHGSHSKWTASAGQWQQLAALLLLVRRPHQHTFINPPHQHLSRLGKCPELRHCCSQTAPATSLLFYGSSTSCRSIRLMSGLENTTYVISTCVITVCSHR
jgi:hypothetical protein